MVQRVTAYASLSGARAAAKRAAGRPRLREILVSVQMVLLPVFIQIGLTFALLFGMATLRTRTLASGETKMRDIALREPN